MAEMRDIVARLTERTAEGSVPWKPTADESAFAASFGDMSLLISQEARVLHGNSTRSTNYKLSVLDEKGYEIDSASHTVGVSSNYSTLPDLYRTAKRQALGIEERLQDLMSRIG